MHNYIHPGNTLSLSAPYEVNSGDCVQIGAIFGVAKFWASLGEMVEIVTTGVFDVKKYPKQVWQIGEKLYWESKDRKITNVGIGNYFIGIVIDPDSGQSAELGRIKIFGFAQ
jgi:predicted RecA/RadA family phage recombinase